MMNATTAISQLTGSHSCSYGHSPFMKRVQGKLIGGWRQELVRLMNHYLDMNVVDILVDASLYFPGPGA